MNPKIATLVNLLSTAQTFSSLYFRDHPRVRSSVSEFVATLRSVLDERGEKSLFLGAARGRVVVDGQVLLSQTLVSQRFLECAEFLCCGGFGFQYDVEPGDVLDFLGAVSEGKDQVRDHVQAGQHLASRGIRSITVSPPFGDQEWMGGELDEEIPETGEFELRLGEYQSLVRVVEDAHGLAEGDRDLEANRARSTVEQILGSLQHESGDLLHLSFYPDYDSYTVGHSVRVSLFTLLMANDLGLPNEILVELGTAALLHDVGKSKIPEEILFKPGALDEEERRVIQMHSWHGGRMLLETEDAGPHAIGAAFGHHIRYDRQGYPSLAPWARVQESTALVQLCDVFEALTAVRPYKASMSPLEAYRIMRESPGEFHPGLLRRLIKVLGLFPPGNQVRLSTGDLGTVLKAGKRLDRPRIRITHDAQDVAYPIDDCQVVDLEDAEHRDVQVDEMLLTDGVVVAMERADSKQSELVRT